MRLLITTAVFTTIGAAAFADCQTNSVGTSSRTDSIAREFSTIVDCLENRLDRLEAQNRALIEQVATLAEIAAQVPSSYSAKDRRDNGATAPFDIANFEITAKPKGRGFEAELDHSVILDLCADGEGCVLSLFSSSEAARSSETRGRVGPCELLYDGESGLWTFGTECGGGSGIDGAGRLPGAENPDGVVLLSIGNDCALTGSALNVRANEVGQAQLSQDRKQGLFLVSGLVTSEGVQPEDDYFCRLSVRD